MSAQLDPPPLQTVAHEHVRAVVRATPAAGRTSRVTLTVQIDTGWKLFGVGASPGIPISLRSEPPGRLRDVVCPAGELTGTIEIHAMLDAADAATRMWLRYQLCSGSICRPPAEVELPPIDDAQRTRGGCVGRWPTGSAEPG